MIESCLDDILFLEMSTEMFQEAEYADYSYIDNIMGISETTEEGLYD